MNRRQLRVVDWSAPSGPNGLRADVLSSRLRVPRTAEGAVRRPRLHRLLDEGLDRGGVILQASAGSGKTQLVATWVHDQRTPRDFAWLTLSEHERDSARFVKYLVAAVHSSPSGRQVMESLAALQSLAVLNETYLLAVSAALADLPRDVVLVLDDFQAVVGSETELLVARMLRYPPGRLRVVVVSRVEPALGQTRLRLQDSLGEIGAAQLAFTQEEAAELALLRGVVLDEHEVRSMTARTGGWAAGLGLVVGALRDAAGDLSRSPDAGGTAIADYLLAEVLEPEPPQLQDFLLRAATVDLICGDLMAELVGSAGAERILADLHRRNLFLERVDAMSSQRRTWYRWHPLLSGLLRAGLHATDPSLEAALHRTASQWLLREGFAAAAVRQSIEAGDVDSAAAVLGDSWLDLVVAGQTDELGALLALFGEDRRAADPELMVACAVVRMQGCDLDLSCRCAGQATELAESLPELRRTAVDAMTTAVRLHRAAMLGVVDDRYYPEALGLLRQMSREGHFLTGSERRRRALLLYHVGAFEASRWMTKEAGRHLAEALGDAAALEVPQLVLRCRAQLASLDLLAGRLGQARTAAVAVIEAIRAKGLHEPHALVIALTTLGGVEILRGEAEAALDHLDEARAAVHEEDHVMRLRVGVLRHAGLRATGKVASAREGLDQLRRQVDDWSAPDVGRGLLAAAEALQLAVEGRGDEALALMDSVSELTPSAAESPSWRVARAKALVSAGSPGEAHAELRHVLEQDGEGPVRVLELAVAAVAAEILGLHDEALRTLRSALDEAASEHVLHPFLLEGPGLRGLLDELLDLGTVHEPQVLEILAQLAPTGPGQNAARYYVEPLTPREVEVLHALQGTATNEEIAERLFVSLNTLRTHIKHIHRKLRTTSRREAVTRARELALL
jgi:LuxR family transcriptional regulator, maltose regulon positive regulatory protein